MSATFAWWVPLNNRYNIENSKTDTENSKTDIENSKTDTENSIIYWELLQALG